MNGMDITLTQNLGENIIILYDSPVHTDWTIRSNRPDIIVDDWNEGNYQQIDIIFPSDRNNAEKEYHNFSKYKDLLT